MTYHHFYTDKCDIVTLYNFFPCLNMLISVYIPDKNQPLSTNRDTVIP